MDKVGADPQEIPGVVAGAFRLYTAGLAATPLVKQYQYECLGRLDLCAEGLTVALWVRLHYNMYTATSNFQTILCNLANGANRPGFHVYFKGRNAKLQIHDQPASNEIVSSFEMPVEKWFHLSFTWQTGQNPVVYINTFTVPISHVVTSQAYTAATPPNTFFYLGYSVQYAAQTTLMDVDDMMVNASAQALSIIRSKYGEYHKGWSLSTKQKTKTKNVLLCISQIQRCHTNRHHCT